MYRALLERERALRNEEKHPLAVRLAGAALLFRAQLQRKVAPPYRQDGSQGAVFTQTRGQVERSYRSLPLKLTTKGSATRPASALCEIVIARLQETSVYQPAPQFLPLPSACHKQNWPKAIRLAERPSLSITLEKKKETIVRAKPAIPRSIFSARNSWIPHLTIPAAPIAHHP